MSIIQRKSLKHATENITDIPPLPRPFYRLLASSFPRAGNFWKRFMRSFPFLNTPRGALHKHTSDVERRLNTVRHLRDVVGNLNPAVRFTGFASKI